MIYPRCSDLIIQNFRLTKYDQFLDIIFQSAGLEDYRVDGPKKSPNCLFTARVSPKRINCAETQGVSPHVLVVIV